MRPEPYLAFLLLYPSLVEARFGGHSGNGSSHHTRTTGHHVNTRHAHYSYHPPLQINHMCRFCTSYQSYPVYHAPPPTYVYKYRESGNPFGMLLAGLALYNLGRASSESRYTHYYHKQSVDEECSMQVIDHNHFDETSIPCFMVSTFMERASSEPQGPQPNQVDITSAHLSVDSFMKTNQTRPLIVTSEQECVIWHNTTLNKERSRVACSLLKQYAETLKPSAVPVYVWLPATLAIVLTIIICGQICCRKKREFKEVQPLNDTRVLGYSSYCP